MAETIENGEYIIEVSLAGGSGRATIISPTRLTVEDNKLNAEIEWNSPNYDYMEIDGEAYYPINKDGNSCFIIDVPGLDQEIPVLAETVAMSEPHMIEYTLYFDSATLKSTNSGVGVIIGAVVIAAAAAAVMFKRRIRRAEK